MRAASRHSWPPCSSPRPALAGTPVSLKADAASTDGVVTLGDLFDGAGAAGAHRRWPTRAGGQVVLDAAAVQMAAAPRRPRLGQRRRAAPDLVPRSAAPPSSRRLGRRRARQHRGPDLCPQPRGRRDRAAATWSGARPPPAPATRPPIPTWWSARRPGARCAPAPRCRPRHRRPPGGQGRRPVDVTFDAEASRCRAGKALADAAVGETSPCRTRVSKKIVQAVVTGPGQAAVGPAADAAESRPLHAATPLR